MAKAKIHLFSDYTHSARTECVKEAPIKSYVVSIDEQTACFYETLAITTGRSMEEVLSQTLDIAMETVIRKMRE